MKKTYLVLSNKPWDERIFREKKVYKKGWHFVKSLDQLRIMATQLCPEYIFVLHWSEMIPPDLYENYETIAFHMTDLPYGRGGSPLQNLVLKYWEDTIVSAFRVTDKLDAGDIYLKWGLSLKGKAQDIYEDCSSRCFSMMDSIIKRQRKPEPQVGKPTYFKRRTPEMSVLPLYGRRRFYDHIRMLDADTYPRAFLRHGDLRLEFSDAELNGDSVTAKVVITHE